MPKSEFKVIIVGGGVAGLTLANALEKGRVDYILLESRNDLTAYVGATIAVTANGGRILDQLKCYDPIAENTISMDDVITWRNGKIIRVEDCFTVNLIRSGYGFSFMDRHFLLQTLYNGLADKSRVLTGKRVSQIDHSRDGVVVQCRDGDTFSGHVVVGADGVHSIVRSEMWRHMSISDPTIPLEADRKALSSEYACMYGVSASLPDMRMGPFGVVVNRDLSFLHSVDKSGRIFWFVFSKMGKVYHVPDIPKFDQQDAEILAKKAFSIQMTDKYTFQDFWDVRESATLAPLEEGWHEHWTWGRIACIGDAIHKWTPNIGQGGNNAIESAAAIANQLHKLAYSNTTSKPKHDEIVQGFTAFHQQRKGRARATYKIANAATRLQALKGPIETFVALWASSWTGDWIVNLQGLSVLGSERIDYLPLPERSFQGSVPFNQNYGSGREPSLIKRAIVALPLIPLAILCKIIFGRILAAPAFTSQAETIMSKSLIDFGTGDTWVIPYLPEPFPFLLTVFGPSLLNIDKNQRLQALTFLTDFASVYLIWILEGHRRANVTRVIYFPVIFGMASQLLGVGCVGPIYYFLHYVQTSLNDYAIGDFRLINMGAVRSALFTVLLLITIPGITMYTCSNLNTRLWINAMWQPFPILVSIVLYICRKILVKDTTQHDRIYNFKADMPYIHFAVWIMAPISSGTFNYVRGTSAASLTELFLPNWHTLTSILSVNNTANLDVVSGMALFLQVDWLSCFSSAYFWLGLWIWDMKDAGLIKPSESWTKIILSAVVGTYIFGPGAVVLLAWSWKEQILATRHAKGACLREDNVVNDERVNVHIAGGHAKAWTWT